MRADHEDLDRGLAALIDMETPPKEIPNLLEIVRLAIAVHAVAEARMFDLLLSKVSTPRTLSMIAAQSRIEHITQRIAAEALTRIRPGSIAWYEQAIELRGALLDHAGRALQTRSTFHDHVPLDVQCALASEYATERMRVLASTSPIRTAERGEAAAPVS